MAKDLNQEEVLISVSSQYIAPIAERIDMSQPTALNMGFAIAHNAIPMTAPMIIATALTALLMR